jgi:hypothetical protein
MFRNNLLETVLTLKEQMMKIEMSNIPTFDDVLLCYSGRRLQFAIKLGILPTPEHLGQVLSKQVFSKKVLSRKVKAKKSILALTMPSANNLSWQSG